MEVGESNNGIPVHGATPRTGESPPLFYVSVISLSPSSSPSHLHNGLLELT